MLAAVPLLLAAQVLTQAPLNAPPKPDRTPTAWACTVDTLMSGKDCLFEASSDEVTDHAAQRTQNVKFARELAKAACAKAAKPAPGTSSDTALLSLCEKDFNAAADLCTLDGKAVLVDGQGRFSATAQSCYRGLADVLQKAALMSSLASGCCRCMASRGCKVNAAACYANVSRGTPGAAERACMANACSDECGEAPAAGGKPVEAAVPTKKIDRRLPAHAL